MNAAVDAIKVFKVEIECKNGVHPELEEVVELSSLKRRPRKGENEIEDGDMESHML